MNFELDLWTWVTGLIMAAHIIAIAVMTVRATYLRRKERAQRKHARKRHRG